MQVDSEVIAAHALHTLPGAYAVLLGSGVSSAAGIPTGWEITKDLVRRVAKMENDAPDDPEQWYRARFGGDPDYSKLLQTLGPTRSERQGILRGYIEPTAEDLDSGRRVPTEAHRAVARLAASGHLRVILTTNFDQLIETALSDENVIHEVIATDDALAGARPLSQIPCVVVKLNGDYMDSRIRNTERELAEYSDKFNVLLDRVFDEYGLIICGWSAAWDRALRTAIERQPSRRYTTWWVDSHTLSREATRLANARQAVIVEGVEANRFFGSLASKVAGLSEADRPHPVSVATAVAELKRLLPDPAHRIRLDDLIWGEARRLRSACNDAANFPLGQHLADEEKQARVKAYEGQTELLETLFGIGCAWDTNPHPFVEALKTTADLSESASGLEELLYLRRYPALRCLYTGGIAAVYHQRWDMLRALTLDATTSHSEIIYRSEGPLPMATALNYWSIFNGRNRGNWLPNQAGKHNPVSSHLFSTLREPLQGSIAVDHEYVEAFDRFEYILGLIIQDTLSQLPEVIYIPDPPVGFFNRDRYSTTRRPPLWERIKTEAEQAGAYWEPIQAGLFGGEPNRFAVAEEKYQKQVLTTLEYRSRR